MHVVIVEFEIEPGRMADFLPLMLANAGLSLEREAGCRVFDVCTDAARRDAVFLYEVYDDATAFAAHLASDHFRAFDAATRSMISRKSVRELTRLAPIPSLTPS